MIKKISIFTLFIFCLTAYSQEKDPIKDYKYYIENEQVISENKEPAHASFSSFTSEEIIKRYLEIQLGKKSKGQTNSIYEVRF
jgi:hypothetical protein